MSDEIDTSAVVYHLNQAIGEAQKLYLKGVQDGRKQAAPTKVGLLKYIDNLEKTVAVLEARIRELTQSEVAG